jgi:hypothetical protein
VPEVRATELQNHRTPEVRATELPGVGGQSVGQKSKTNYQYPIFNAQCPSANGQLDYWKLDVDYWIFETDKSDNF